MGDEGLCLPNVKILCLCKYKTIETSHQRQQPNLSHNWADTSQHLLLLKSSMITNGVWYNIRLERYDKPWSSLDKGESLACQITFPFNKPVTPL